MELTEVKVWSADLGMFVMVRTKSALIALQPYIANVDCFAELMEGTECVELPSRYRIMLLSALGGNLGNVSSEQKKIPCLIPGP